MSPLNRREELVMGSIASMSMVENTLAEAEER
jgi:hypothetical protein